MPCWRSLLTGDPTLTFVLKGRAATTLVITVTIFGYYLVGYAASRRPRFPLPTEAVRPPLRALVIGAVLVVVIAAVGYSVLRDGQHRGSSGTYRLDQRNGLMNLRNISRNIDTYLELERQEMPESLSELARPRYFVRSIEDPESSASYEYRVIEGHTYELCAVFATRRPPGAGHQPAFLRIHVGPRRWQDLFPVESANQG